MNPGTPGEISESKTQNSSMLKKSKSWWRISGQILKLASQLILEAVPGEITDVKHSFRFPNQNFSCVEPRKSPEPFLEEFWKESLLRILEKYQETTF